MLNSIGKPSIRISFGHVRENFIVYPDSSSGNGLMKGILIVQSNFVIFEKIFSVCYKALLYAGMLRRIEPK